MNKLSTKDAPFIGYLVNTVFPEKFTYQEKEALNEFTKSDDKDTNYMAAIMVSKMLEDRQTPVSRAVFDYIDYAIKNKNFGLLDNLIKVTYAGKFTQEEENLVKQLIKSEDTDNILMARQIIYTKTEGK